MLIDINLLPQQERRSKVFFISIILLIFLAIASLIVASFYVNTVNKKIERYESDSSFKQQLIIQEESKIENIKGDNSITELEKAVTWAEQYPIKTVPLIQELTSLLPERGYIQEFSYQETGEVTLKVQFDTSREAAYYLKNLLDSKWIQDAFLNSLNTEEIEDEKGEENQEVSENDKTTESDEEENILPRYIGEYSIVLNKDFIKQEENLNESSDEGGDNS